MYLIQRGHFRTEMVNKLSMCESFLSGRPTSLISPDYMGSVEFEFGAVPASYIRIMDKFEDYQNFIHVLYAKNGVPINIFCKKSSFAATYNDVCEYIKGNDPHYISTYFLKEYISLANKFYGFDSVFSKRDDNFWWDIKADFFIYTGATDRQKAIEYVLNQDYTHWWFTMDDTTKQEKIKQAYKF